jgi:ribosome-associated protein
MISRSEQKRQHKQIEAIARELTDLSETHLRQLPVSPELKEAVRLCRTVKAGALKRQIKYVAKMLKSEPLEDTVRLLTQMRGSRLEENRLLHESERIRDAIVNEALEAAAACHRLQEPWTLDWFSETINETVTRLPAIDENELRSLAHRYALSRNKTCYREIFRVIRGAIEKQRLEEL